MTPQIPVDVTVLGLSLTPFWFGVLASVVSGFGATALGAVPVLWLRRMDERVNNALLAAAGGIMLAATFFSLLMPALDLASETAGKAGGGLGVILALLLGGGVLALAHALLPHEHFAKGLEGGTAPDPRLARIWLFVIAIGIHNLPEGLSVGVGAGSGNLATGLAVMLGIGLQNVPEGLAVAVALASRGYRPGYALGVAALTGLVEPVGGVLGAGAVALSGALLPWALAFAAGAMLFVISDEIIPETHREGLEKGATAALFGGFVLMMYLDTVLS